MKLTSELSYTCAKYLHRMLAWEKRGPMGNLLKTSREKTQMVGSTLE